MGFETCQVDTKGCEPASRRGVNHIEEGGPLRQTSVGRGRCGTQTRSRRRFWPFWMRGSHASPGADHLVLGSPFGPAPDKRDRPAFER